MGFYSRGLAACQKQLVVISPYQRAVSVSGFEVWKGVKTPGAIRNEVERINAQILATSSDIHAELERKGAFPPDLNNRPEDVLPLVGFFERTWTPFIQGWQAFNATHGAGTGWTANVWGGYWDAAQDWLLHLQQIREKAKAVGFDLESSMDIVEPTKSDLSNLGGETWSMFKTAYWVAVAVAIGWLLFKGLALLGIGAGASTGMGRLP